MPRAPIIHQPLDVYLQKIAEDQYKLCRYAEIMRCQNAVTMIRRHRGSCPSDNFGFFSGNGSNAWLGDAQGSMSFANLHPVFLLKTAVNLYATAMVSGRVQLKVDAANKNPTLGGAANIARGLYEFMDNHDGYWNERLEARIALTSELHYGVFLRSDDQGLDSVMEEDWGDEDMPVPGKYVCGHCGSEGPYMPEEGQQKTLPAQSGRIPCPQCRELAELSKEPSSAPMEVPKGQKKKQIGSPRTSVISPFQIRLDERRSMCGDLNACEWFDYGEWLSEPEMDGAFHGFDYGEPQDGSFPMRWKYRLETGVDIFNRRDSKSLVKMWEVRNRWLRPEFYANRVEPSTYQMKDGQGRVIWEIGKGEKLIEQFPGGFLYKTTGGANEGSQGVLLPFIEESDFRKQWVYIYFTPDGFSFWGQPLIELISLNDDATEMYTIDIQHRERNSQVSIVFNDQMFDEDSFENDLIPTKAGVTQEQPLDWYFRSFETPPMQEAMQGLKMILELGPSMGMTPTQAAIGSAPQGEPNYSALLLQKQSSLGKLASYGQSKAQGKKEWFVQQVEIVQSCWPPERFEYLRTRLGEEWKPEDIEAFLNCNVRKDIEVDYVSGTEIPTSQIERQLTLNNVVQQIAPLLASNPDFMPKEAVASVIRQWAEASNLDVDIDNAEGEERLCTSRLETIKQGMESLGGKYPPEQLVAIIMQHPQMHVMPNEDHKIAIEFFTDQQIAAMTETEPDQTYVTILQNMIDKHETAIQDKQQKEMAANPEVQAQLVAQQQQGEQAAQQQQMELQAQQQSEAQKAELESQKLHAQIGTEAMKATAESERTQAESADAENERAHELETMHIKHAQETEHKERDHGRARELEGMRIDAATKQAKETAKKKETVKT